jgi:hypothetical protein
MAATKALPADLAPAPLLSEKIFSDALSILNSGTIEKLLPILILADKVVAKIDPPSG